MFFFSDGKSFITLFNNKPCKFITIYLCKYKSGKMKLSKEHQSYQWVPMNEIKADYPEWIRESLKHGLQSLHHTSSLRKRDKIKRNVRILRTKMKRKLKKKKRR